jgi:hypothetical protein
MFILPCVLFFYQINGGGEIRTRDHLVIKALIPCQITNSTQKLKLLGEVPGYDLYYFLIFTRLYLLNLYIKIIFYLSK